MTLVAEQSAPPPAVEDAPKAVSPHRLWLAGLLVAAGVLATLGTWADVTTIALHDEEASHVWLVLPLAGFLVYVRRASVAQSRVKGAWIGPMLCGLGWAVGHYGFNHATQSFWHLGALLVLMGCAVSVLGVEVCQRALPAVLLLVFLVPMPATARQQVAIPLERVTARSVQWILSRFPIAITRLGNSLSINGHQVRVAEECNGMRMIFPLFLIAYVFVFILPLRRGVQAFLLLISPAVAVLANVVRLIPTVFIFGYASEKTANQFHDISGWIMLPMTFLILMGLLRVLKMLGIRVNRKSVYNGPEPARGLVAAATSPAPVSGGLGGAWRGS